MKITRIRISNFRSFGPAPTVIELSDLTYVLGPNGSGKTVVLEALSRLFSPVASQRKIRLDDFHVPTPGPSGRDTSTSLPLWIEVEIEYPEAGDDATHPSVPPNFGHMAIDSPDGVPRNRIRLTASIAADGEVEERIEYVLEADANGDVVRRADMPRFDRGNIEVHYLPARRDPADHISYTASSLIGRVLRAADWTAERDVLNELSTSLSDALADNEAVASIGERLTNQWSGLHSGTHFRDPFVAFGHGELEGVLRHLTIKFEPGLGTPDVTFDRLSDGQKSLLYISLVLAWHELAGRVLSGLEPSLDPDRLRAPVHMLIALEEPENSLAPQYLGRIVRRLRMASEAGTLQAVLATHSSALLRRVDPQSIRFLRLDAQRRTTVRTIRLPKNDDTARKYVREAVMAFPELYFARFVVLGEGDSEQVVLPRVLAAAGIVEDDASVSVAPLGGRHVNHFWRLLNDLGIPHATLLDLDAGRYHGGWGRVRNGLKQINAVSPNTFDEAKIAALPKWNDDHAFPERTSSAVRALEQRGVFFSSPLDLDLMMLAAYPDAYGVGDPGPGLPKRPDENLIVSVLGKSHANEKRLPVDLLAVFEEYHRLFDVGSKPSAHIKALSSVADADLLAGLPPVLDRLVDFVRDTIARLPE